MARRRSRSMQQNLQAAFVLLGLLLTLVGPAIGCFIFAPMLNGLGLPILAAAFFGTVFAEAMALFLVWVTARRGR